MAASSLLRTRPALVPLSRTLASSPPPPPPDPVKHVAALIKKGDPHAYQASYFFPPGRPREAFLAYRALNLELEKIEETTTNANIGKIKLQWWKDVVQDVSNGKAPPDHPVARALSLTATRETADLTAYYWGQIIDGRKKAISTPPPSTLTQLLQALTLSHTPLHYLSLSLLSAPPLPIAPTKNPPKEGLQAIQHLSLSTSLVNLLQGMPVQARAERLPALPVDLRVAHGVTPSEVAQRGGEARGLKEAVYELATRANDELETSRREWEGRRVGREWMAAFLPAISTQSYLDRLQKADFDPFDPVLQRRDWKVPLGVWWAVKRGRY